MSTQYQFTYENSLALLKALKRLQAVATAANAAQHAGYKPHPSVWSEMYEAENQAREAIQAAEAGGM